MGGCCSAPREESGTGSATQDSGSGAAAASSRRQHRQRDRTSLERQNAEARDQLLAGRGGMSHVVVIVHKSSAFDQSSDKSVEAPTYRQHGSWVANPPITRKDLEHQRTAFWETADTFGGRKEVWDVLRAAVNCNDVESSRTMISGAELRLLGDGDLIHGCYDSTGFFYKIPENCLSDPTNLLKDDVLPNPIQGSTNIVQQFPEAQLLDMKVRLSHNSQDLIVKVAMIERVSSVAIKIQGAAGVKRLKLMVLGKMLKDDGTQTLKDAGWSPGLIVQGLVTQA